MTRFENPIRAIYISRRRAKKKSNQSRTALFWSTKKNRLVEILFFYSIKGCVNRPFKIIYCRVMKLK